MRRLLLPRSWPGKLVFVAVNLVLIGYLDSLDQALSQSLLYGLLCMWAGYHLHPRMAALVVAACIGVHLGANLIYSPRLPDYIQSGCEGLLLTVVAMGGRIQSLSRRDAALAHARLLQHLERAREVQSDLLGGVSTALQPYEMAVEFEVAVELGGDVFFVCPIPDGLFLFVGDVSGKGPRAALAATSIRVLMDFIVHATDSPGEALEELQRRFLALFPSGLFVTAFCARAYPNTNRFTYAVAGHEPALLRRNGGGDLEELSGLSLPIGVDSQEKFPDMQTAFGPGDRLLVYTDGLYDARNPRGLEPVEVLLAKSGDDGGKLARELLELAPAPRHDDVMVLVLSYLPAAVLLEPVVVSEEAHAL